MQKRIRNKSMWILLTLLLILIVISTFIIQSKQLKEYSPYVSDSPSPTGVKAFYTYLENNSKVKRWTHSPEFLPGNMENQILVMVEPYFMPVSEEMEAYMDFLESGNTILLFKKNPKGMFDVSTEWLENDYSIDEQVLYDHNEREYHAAITSPVRLQTSGDDQILLYDEAGTIAFKRHIGEGQLIIANSPDWLMNENILNEEHLPLLLSLLKEGNSNTFLFDEYIHGGKGAAATLSFYPMWFLVLLLQGGVLAILWLWYKGKRFGPIYTPREETVRFSDEGIRALAAWYRRGRRYHESLAIQADYVKLLLQERWRIPYRQDWRELSDQIEKKWPRLPKIEIETLLNGLANILEREKINKQEYLLWSKKIDRIRKEVEDE